MQVRDLIEKLKLCDQCAEVGITLEPKSRTFEIGGEDGVSAEIKIYRETITGKIDDVGIQVTCSAVVTLNCFEE
jgi:hypothetical protein